jgi:hypothetical protein
MSFHKFTGANLLLHENTKGTDTFAVVLPIYIWKETIEKSRSKTEEIK